MLYLIAQKVVVGVGFQNGVRVVFGHLHGLGNGYDLVCVQPWLSSGLVFVFIRHRVAWSGADEIAYVQQKNTKIWLRVPGQLLDARGCFALSWCKYVYVCVSVHISRSLVSTSSSVKLNKLKSRHIFINRDEILSIKKKKSHRLFFICICIYCPLGIKVEGL